MIVGDASAVLEILRQTSAGEAVARRLFEPHETLHAPHLLDVEVAQVVRGYAGSGEIDGERVRVALADLADFPFGDIRTSCFWRELFERHRDFPVDRRKMRS